MSTPLRVGIIGLGARCSIAENCQVSSVPVELVGRVVMPNLAMRERAREILGDHPWVESLEELLDRGN